MLAGERLRVAVESKAVQHGSFDEAVTVSLGVATATPEMQSFDDLIKAADEALYAAKEAGRNRVCGAAPTVAPDAGGQSERRSA